MYVDADRTRIEQILQNLLTNASRYTPPAGNIVLTAARHRGDIVLSVKDNGIGIPAEFLPHVFDQFAQGPRAFERGGGGLGLGLALVRRLAEIHGGTVEAASEGQGRGAELVVRLPACDDAALSVQSGQDDSRSSPRSVLVVHATGNAEAQAVTAMLRSRGDDVHTSHDGVGGAETAEALKPDVVVFDVGFDGNEACRRIGERPWGQCTCVVAHAAAPDPRASTVGGRAEAQSIDADGLVSLIDRIFAVARGVFGELRTGIRPKRAPR